MIWWRLVLFFFGVFCIILTFDILFLCSSSLFGMLWYSHPVLSDCVVSVCFVVAFLTLRPLVDSLNWVRLIFSSFFKDFSFLEFFRTRSKQSNKTNVWQRAKSQLFWSIWTTDASTTNNNKKSENESVYFLSLVSFVFPLFGNINYCNAISLLPFLRVKNKQNRFALIEAVSSS